MADDGDAVVELTTYLRSMGIRPIPAEKYATALVDEGYDTTAKVDTMSLSELEEVGLKKGHLADVEAYRQRPLHEAKDAAPPSATGEPEPEADPVLPGPVHGGEGGAASSERLVKKGPEPVDPTPEQPDAQPEPPPLTEQKSQPSAIVAATGEAEPEPEVSSFVELQPEPAATRRLSWQEKLAALSGICEVPSHWAPMASGANLLEAELDPDVDRHVWQGVQQRVAQSLPEFRVVSIARVQNVDLWRNYCTYCLKLSMRSPENAVGPFNGDRELFHGCAPDVMRLIVGGRSAGFDSRLSGVGGSEYGGGAYFALVSEPWVYPCSLGRMAGRSYSDWGHLQPARDLPSGFCR